MKDLYKELAEYTGRELELVRQRCRIAGIELSWLWEKFKDDPIAFYRETDLYIFDLTSYQMALQRNKVHIWYQYMIKQYGWKTGLDYGGGIGEYTILAFEAGINRMVFMEVANSETLKYAVWRIKKHNLYGEKKRVPIIEIASENYKIDRDFDFIMVMDVLEHLENPEPVIKKLHEHTEWIFCNPKQIRYNWLYPQHISKFDLSPYFENVDLYLWRRK